MTKETEYSNEGQKMRNEKAAEKRVIVRRRKSLV